MNARVNSFMPSLLNQRASIQWPDVFHVLYENSYETNPGFRDSFLHTDLERVS